MRSITTDNRRVIARNATLLGFATRKIKAGTFFVYNDAGQLRAARSLGRIASCDSDGDDCTGFVLAMVLHASAGFAFERWVNPDDITEAYDAPPAAMAAFFFVPALPYDAQTMRRLMEHGAIQNQFVDQHANRVAMFVEHNKLAKQAS